MATFMEGDEAKLAGGEHDGQCTTRLAKLETVPVFVHTNVTPEDIARLADQDNENDEYHVEVPLPDVWAEYHRLAKEEGWTQQRIADAKGCVQPTVALRIKCHTSLPAAAKAAVSDEMFDEGHCEAVLSVVSDVGYLSPWLDTAQAQTELVAEVLGKHRGGSAEQR